jgi:DNA-binding response OmpR family regulator
MNETGDGGSQTPHVLIVEDDDLVGETILAMLDDTCHATLVTDTGTALETLDAETAVDVVILDCLLPGGGTARLLAQADTMRVPVIIISGSSAEIARIGGSRPALPKPFSADELIDLVRKVASTRP